jgi:tetratricopeptide (TPR) repeat protein
VIVAEPNDKLRLARESVRSRANPDEPMSRSELALAVNTYLWAASNRRRQYNLTEHTLGRYERGEIRWPSADYRRGLRVTLNAVDDSDLGFWPTRRGATVSPSASMARGVDRGGSVDLGMSPTAFLAKISANTPVPKAIGWSEVDHVQAVTRAVAMSENLHGGGLSAEAGISQLRWSGRLLEVRASNDVRRAMFEAVGNLSSVVAFSAFDIADYQSADECFEFALWCADQGASWALRANTLAEMARKATYLGDLDEALSLIEFAQVRSDRVSATAQAMMAAIRGRLLALVGRHDEAGAEVDRADEQFARRVPVADPPWLCYYDEAEHQGSTGRALIPAAREMKRLDLAVPRLEAAIQLHNEDYRRSRTFSRTRLASLMMAAGDPHEAVPIGRQALADAAPLHSERVVSELLGLARAAERHTRIEDVADLRHEITLLPFLDT